MKIFIKSGYVIVAILLLWSCNENESTSSDTTTFSILVKITSPAGASWASNGGQYLAAPFNVGTYKKLPILVLNDAIKKGKEISVIPIGVIKLREGKEINHYVIAVPKKVGKQTIDIDDFSDLVTVHSSAKWIIEQYLISRNGMGSASLVSWEDQDYVINKLLNNNI